MLLTSVAVGSAPASSRAFAISTTPSFAAANSAVCVLKSNLAPRQLLKIVHVEYIPPKEKSSLEE